MYAVSLNMTDHKIKGEIFIKIYVKIVNCNFPPIMATKNQVSTVAGSKTPSFMVGAKKAIKIDLVKLFLLS